MTATEASNKGVWRVPALLALVFAGGVTSVGTLIVRSTGDASFGIEPEYYAKSLAWDSMRREKADSDALGWSCAVTVQDGELRANITGRDGVPVDAAEVRAEVFAWARSKDRRTLALEGRGGGVYAGNVGAGRATPFEAGIWQVRLRAEADGRVFVQEAAVQAGVAAHVEASP